MENAGRMQKKWDTKRTVIFLIVVILLKILIQWALYEDGFLSVSADEFARGIRAATWAEKPSFDILFDLRDTWLPFEKYLNGATLLIFPDVVWAPRLTVFIASCGVSIILFFLFEILFENSFSAALSVIFLIFQPWFAWLSGTPMMEMYYFLFLFLGIYLFIFWTKRERAGYLFGAGLAFLIATGFHVQSWVYINLFNLLTITYLIKLIKEKQFKKIISLVGFYFLGNALIFVFSLIEFIDTGRIFGFLSAHTHYSKWYYGGYSATVLEKLLYYPKLIFGNLPISFWFLFIVAIIFILRERDRVWKMLPLLYAFLVLLTNSVMNVLSVPATAAPGRYALIYLILFAPYFADGLVRVFSLRLPDSQKALGYGLKIVALVIFLYALVWGFQKMPDYDRTVSMDAVKTGKYIHTQLNEYPSGQAPNFMVELKYWDFLGVQMAAGFYDQITFDREYDLYNRDIASILLDEGSQTYQTLVSQEIKYLALRSEQLKNHTEAMAFLQPLKEIGEWTVYEFVLDQGH